MGHHIESYSIAELERVALPGAAVSALFWVIPVGVWPEEDLSGLWRHFTADSGYCNELGLLLVKGAQRGDREADRANLAAAATTIEAGAIDGLLPTGAREHSTQPDMRLPGLLVLSGAYPQPGWGVWLDASRHRRGEDLEGVIRKTLEKMPEYPGRKCISQSAQHWKLLERLRSSKPVAPQRAQAFPVLASLLKEVVGLGPRAARDNAAATKRFLERYQSARVGNRELHDLLVIDQDELGGTLGDLKQALSMPGLIEKNLGEDVTKMLESTEQDAQNAEFDRSGRVEARFRAVVKALQFARRDKPTLTWDQFPQWFKEFEEPRVQGRVQQLLTAIEGTLTLVHGQVSGEEATTGLKYQAENEAWRRKLETAELAYRAVLKDAVAAQWVEGPRFLLQLQDTARSIAIPCSSIPWDPARMVGWKLQIRVPSVTAQSLVVASNGLLPTPVNGPGHNQDFDGSLFSDYVHFLAVQDSRVSPRQAARHVLKAMTNVQQVIDALASEGCAVPQNPTQDTLMEQLLAAWGWNPPGAQARPLAACIQSSSTNSAATLRVSVNDVRITLEAFVRDILRVALAELAWNDCDALQKIGEYCPEFDPGRRRTWEGLLADLTVGGGVVLLRKLLPLAFPELVRRPHVVSLCERLEKVCVPLNKGSHNPEDPHQAQHEFSEKEKSDISEMIAEVILNAARVVGEMPWHLQPTIRSGTQPVIVTGYAWSHSHPEDRLVRVMLLRESNYSGHLLVWNPTRKNPVMTDARILRT